MKNTNNRLKTITLLCLGFAAVALPSCVAPPPPPRPVPARAVRPVPVAVRRGPVLVRPAVRAAVRPGPIVRRW